MIATKETIGIIAGILSIIGFIPYAHSILKGETKPARATWFIWTAVTIMLFFTYREVGGGAAIWLSLGYAIGVGATAILAIKYGTGGWETLDKIVIGLAALAIGVWFVTGSAFIALLMTMCADILGAIPAIKHAYTHPEEENKLGWAIGFSANVINLFAVESWDFTHAAYPIYLFLMVGTITYFVWKGRAKSA